MCVYLKHLLQDQAHRRQSIKIFLLPVGYHIILLSPLLLPLLHIICHETLGTLSCLLTLGFNQWDDYRRDVNR